MRKLSNMSVVKLNGEEIEGPMGCLVAFLCLVFIGFIMLMLALILLSPILIPILIGILIGKAT